ncbi:MAG TPA: crosslink repair DNA glycosylase YcaQ family protein [Candidatus Dormibacteraeota bacterium]|nr:crosslink repair DNA glycosylase YcaQ family protein [Candidatus Dormibacteraeota bacterium]
MARRLAVSRQGLAGPRPNAGQDGILAMVRQLGCVQLDPISVVAPSHRLVLWSRLGNYDRTALETLQWETRRLFEYWAHAASIVLTEDYPIHRRFMRAWSRGETPWSRRFHPWVEANASLKRHVLSELRHRGPLPGAAFEDRSVRAWQSSGWTAGRNVDRMLAYLWMSGAIVVARREAGRRWWDLAARWLPAWTPKARLSEKETVRQAAQRSLRALGIARSIHIQQHFISGRYPGLADVLEELHRSGEILLVQVRAGEETWPGSWYVHAKDVPLLEDLEARDWQPRTTLLSPFDNLIRDRVRTRTMFGFDYGIEIYVPAARRKYGYYVLPILHGDRLIGRIDAALDRKRQNLDLRAVYAEDSRASPADGAAATSAIAELGRFLEAKTITATRTIPPAWKRTFGSAF